MSKAKILAGTTSYIADMFIQDSSSTTGAGLTGLTNASSSLVAYYKRKGQATATAISLSAGTVGTWSSGGFKEVDATNMPGYYELGIPNAALAAGAIGVIVALKGATNMAPTGLEFELDLLNYQDAAAAGLTRIDATISSRMASGNVTVGTNNDKTGYTVSTNSDKTGYTLDLTQALNTASTGDTVGGALVGARAQAFGKWTLVGTTLTLYAANATTVVRTFTLDSGTTPTSRT